MRMSDHIEQQVVQEIFCRKYFIPLENSKTGFFCFIRVGEAANISQICYIVGGEIG